MENRFKNLIALIEPLKNDSYGEWFVDREHKEDDESIQFPYPIYTEVVDKLIDAIYQIEENYPEYELTRYGEILEKHSIKWGQREMESVDVSNMDLQCVLALLMGMVRAERFCDGAIMGMLRSGAVLRWLQRIEEIYESSK